MLVYGRDNTFTSFNFKEMKFVQGMERKFDCGYVRICSASNDGKIITITNHSGFYLLTIDNFDDFFNP